jgi:hypothetical protein
MAWNELFASVAGLASLLTVAGVIVIGFGVPVRQQHDQGRRKVN